MKTVLFLLFLFNFAIADSINIEKSSYLDAKQSEQYLRFDLVSWKLGLFKSTFKNYVKKFKVDYTKKGTQIENIVVTFNVVDMDTDTISRNEKMWDFCLDYKKHHTVQVQIKDKIDLTKEDSQIVRADITLRGKTFPIGMDVIASNVNGKSQVKGMVTTSLSALQIPDPSIAVGRLEDGIKIEFQVQEP